MVSSFSRAPKINNGTEDLPTPCKEVVNSKPSTSRLCFPLLAFSAALKVCRHSSSRSSRGPESGHCEVPESARQQPLPPLRALSSRGILNQTPFRDSDIRGECRVSFLTSTRVARLQRMRMIRRFDDHSVLLLPADETVLHPGVRQNLVHSRSFLRFQFQHASNDMPGFSRQESQQSYGSLDRNL